jgi:formylglycine-generating enzyme required for sulfatase activity
MKNTKGFICAVQAALCAVFVLASCFDPLQAPESGGSASLVVRIAAPGRTLMPVDPVFARYAVTAKVGDSEIPAEQIDGSGITGAGAVISGLELNSTVTVTVSGYANYPTGEGGAQVEYLAARGSWTGTVAPGRLCEITLTPIPVNTAGAPDGIFKYTITLPQGLSAATLAFGEDDDAPINLLTSASGSVTKAPGYYPVLISLKKKVSADEGAAELQSAVYEYAHIYSGLETQAVLDLSDVEFAQYVYIKGEASSTATGTVSAYSAYTDNTTNTPIMDGETAVTGAVSEGNWYLKIPAAWAGKTVYVVLTDEQNAAAYTSTTLTLGPLPIAGIPLARFEINSEGVATEAFIASFNAKIVEAQAKRAAYGADRVALFGLETPRDTTWITPEEAEAFESAIAAAQTFSSGIEQGTTTAGAVQTALDGLETAIGAFEALEPRYGYGYTMVAVPPGKFQRDADPANVSVITKDYKLGAFEVTQELFLAVMGINPSANRPDSPLQDGSSLATTTEYNPLLPVDGGIDAARTNQSLHVSHIIKFCNKLSVLTGRTPVYTVNGVSSWTDYGSDNWTNTSIEINAEADGYRLPTEMEWMWAAMGADRGAADFDASGVNVKGYKKDFAGDSDPDTIGDSPVAYAWTSAYSAGNGSLGQTYPAVNPGSIEGDRSANAGNHKPVRSQPVGSKLPNELGLYDMSGNLSEYLIDTTNTDSAFTGSLWGSGTLTDWRKEEAAGRRVVIGGDYGANLPVTVSRAQWENTYNCSNDWAHRYFGFRIAQNSAAPTLTPVSGGVKVTFKASDETISLSTVADPVPWATGSITVNVEETFAAYQWYLDGVVLSGETGQSVTIQANTLRAGAHELALKATKNGAAYSKTVAFTVQ